MIGLLFALVIVIGALAFFLLLWVIDQSDEITQLRRMINDESKLRERDVTWLQDYIDKHRIAPVTQMIGRAKRLAPEGEDDAG